MADHGHLEAARQVGVASLWSGVGGLALDDTLLGSADWDSGMKVGMVREIPVSEPQAGRSSEELLLKSCRMTCPREDRRSS